MIRSLVLSASLLASSAAVAQTTTPAPADPARVAIGRSIAARLLPDGSYQKIMGGSFSHMMDGMTEQMMSMPMAQIIRMSGLSPTQAPKMGTATMHQIMEIVDPAFEQRMHIMMPIMMQQMGQLMGRYEPALRDGLAEAYARHLTLAQLTDLDRFLQTPSGSAYAAQAMEIQTDPAVIAKMQAVMPEIFKAMPAIMEKVQAATASLPKPKTAADLTDADRAQLAKLLGVDPAKLKTSAKEPTS
jgi:hypothetical protein